MELSKYFTQEEFELSQIALRKNIKNTMDQEQLGCSVTLCNEVLEVIREKFGPVIINSGFRGEALNDKIGGAVSSQHLRGEAADIRVVGYTAYTIADWLTEDSGLEFDQCILEYDSWVHISFTERYANRNEVLTINQDGTHQGLVI